MGSKTQYLMQASLDHVLGGPAFVPPEDLWFVLSSSAFDPLATGDSCSELTNTDYARVEQTNDTTLWTPATTAVPAAKSNILDLIWTTATEDWPEVPASIYVGDAASGGNLLYGADFNDPQSVALGDTFKVLSGTFIFNED